MGAPSAKLKSLSDVWNQATTYTREGDKQNTAIPITAHTGVLGPDDLEDSNNVKDAIGALKVQLAATTEEIDKKNIQFELTFLERRLKQLQDVK